MLAEIISLYKVIWYNNNDYLGNFEIYYLNSQIRSVYIEM